MDRYVNEGTDGWTELRVHGVGGTSPESELGHPAVLRVAGDRQAGFYRRVWDSRRGTDDPPGFRREGYSWGGLTSGDNKRALWLLLLPFMLLNMAFYMDPGHSAERRRRSVEARIVAQRLLALSLTGTAVLAATSVSMDLVGWQCGAAGTGGPHCANGGVVWLNWMRYGWLAGTGRHLAVAAVLPLAVIGLLWYLAHTTWARFEKRPVPQSVQHPDNRTLLENRQLWNGNAAVRRLRLLHVAGATALVGVLLLAPLPPGRDLTRLWHGSGWGTTPLGDARNAVLLALLVLLAWVVLRVALPRTGKREQPTVGEPLKRDRDGYSLLPLAAALLTAGAVVVAVWRDERLGPAPAELPWQVGATQWVLGAQGALLAVLFVTHVPGMIGALRGRRGEDRESGFDNPDFPRPAWGGLTMSGVALLATALATALSAGLTLRVAEILGAPAVPGQTPNPGGQRLLVVPTAYYWAAAVGLASTAAAVALTGMAWAGIRRGRAASARQVADAYPEAEVDRDEQGVRCTRIAASWDLAGRLDGAAQSVLGRLLATVALITVAGTVLGLILGVRLVTEGPRWFLTLANLVLTGLVAAILWAGRQAYRSERFRRTVGVLWDIGTFWPRATHPFAPPCYAERTVPDLLERLEYLTPATGDPAKDGRVVFSCHSQGCVIGTAVLLQARTPASKRTALLTYGNPVTRLYVRFFPAYFDVRTLRRVGELLTDEGRWRWNNLYRPSDPIGGWVIVDDPLPPHAAARPRAAAGCLPGAPDRQLLDPCSFGLRPGDSCYEEPLGHSDYFADQAYGDIVLAWRNSTAQQPVPGPAPAARPVVREETPRVSAVRPWWPWQRLRPY
ncbi:hypothetical protein ABZZ74_00765 [Streptomyces sp. NPDC006476]|uniref:hypothetical protein n=1 Tax=Streptomyces sp. NPDC006476 TaxID=3157175 RepID=UPI0033B6ECDB